MPTSITCGSCSERVAALDLNPRGVLPNSGCEWLQCPSCLQGSVRMRDGAVWPVAPAGTTVVGLPTDVAQAWREARTTHAVAAYTASEIMCRKILMHLAVDFTTSKPGGTFKGYIDALEKAGYIATGLKPAVSRIKDRGNTANHDLPASTEEESSMTLRITEHLLRELYEFPALHPAEDA